LLVSFLWAIQKHKDKPNECDAKTYDWNYPQRVHISTLNNRFAWNGIRGFLQIGSAFISTTERSFFSEPPKCKQEIDRRCGQAGDNNFPIRRFFRKKLSDNHTGNKNLAYVAKVLTQFFTLFFIQLDSHDLNIKKYIYKINLFSMIGILLSLGLVTKNAILLVDRANDQRAKGLSARDAILEAGPTRVRPILMTTLTMVLGMMPLALALGAGSEIRQSMVTVVIGALLNSTLMTLVLVPVVYTYMEGWRARLSRKKATPVGLAPTNEKYEGAPGTASAG
jgi:hypothetical protein